MEPLTLIRAARALGLSISVEGDRLIVRGPKSAGVVAEALLADKPAVMSALEHAAQREVPLDWPDDARDHFLNRLRKADDPGRAPVPGPGSQAWEIAIAEANRVAAKVPVPEGGLKELRLIDRALAAFAPMGGLKLDRIARREQLDPPLPNPNRKQSSPPPSNPD